MNEIISETKNIAYETSQNRPFRANRPIALAIIACIVLSLPVLFVLTKPKASSPSPIVDSGNQNINTIQSTSKSSSLYSPSQYIYFSQSYFADARMLSEKLEQSEDDKHQILSNIQQAIDTITEGIAIYPNRSELWAHRADIYLAITRISNRALAQAIYDLEEAHKRAPDNPDYTRKLSELYLRQCNQTSCSYYSRALLYLSKTVRMSPNDPQLLYGLAALQVRAGKLKDASESFARLLPLVSPDQKQQVLAQKETVEKLLAQASGEYQVSKGSMVSNATLDTSDTSIQNPSPKPTAQGPQPKGLELLPEQQARSGHLIVASGEEESSPYTDAISNSAFSGKAVIPAGKTLITIENTNVKDTSPVYVAAITKTNATLTITSKKQGSYFTVTIDNVETKDIEFQYWVTE